MWAKPPLPSQQHLKVISDYRDRTANLSLQQKNPVIYRVASNII